MAYIDDVYSVVQIQPTGIEAFVRLSQNENGRRLYFAITGGEIPTGSTATLSGTKPDGVVYSKTGTITGNVVTILEDVQLTAAAGPWPAKLRILNGGNVVATGRIRFVIDKDPVAAGAVPSDSQLEGLVAEAAAYAEAAKDGAYYGSPLTASTVAGMTDKNRVYVYTGSESGYTAGNWYYWNGSAWTSGGVYNSQGIQTDKTLTVTGMAADAKAVGDALKAVQVETDKTLTQADVPADAKAVGDEIESFRSYSTNKFSNLEMTDDSIREDVTSLKADFSDTVNVISFFSELEQTRGELVYTGWRLKEDGTRTGNTNFNIYAILCGYAGDDIDDIFAYVPKQEGATAYYQFQNTKYVSTDTSIAIGSVGTEPICGKLTVPTVASGGVYFLYSVRNTVTNAGIYTSGIKSDIETQTKQLDSLNGILTNTSKGTGFFLSSLYAATGTGIYNNNNRVLFSPPDNAVLISMSDDIEVSVYAYKNLEYKGVWDLTSFRTSAVWLKGEINLNDFYNKYPEYNVKCLARYADNSDISDISDIENKITFVTVGAFEPQKKFFYNDRYYRNVSAMTIIGNKLYVFPISNTDDNETVNYDIYTLSRGFITMQKNNKVGTSNFGHNNTVDYSDKNGYLLTSNAGSAMNTNASKLYLFKDAKDLTNFDVANAVTIDISQDGRFGKQPNAVWAMSDFGRYDIIAVVSNYESGNMSAFEQNNVCDYTGESIRFVHIVQLGKGTNQLESGQYVAQTDASAFNGTYKVIEEYTFDFVYYEAINDMVYYRNHILYNTINPTPLIVDLEFTNGELIKRRIPMILQTDDGTAFAEEGEGIAISDNGYVYFGFKGFNIFSIDNIM